MTELFIHAWLTFSLMVTGTSVVIAFLAWKFGLFHDQERARHLALYSQVQEQDAEES